MDDSDDIVKEFLIESHENLDRLDQDLIALEKNPTDRETLGSIFRTIHTIKGTSGFLAFDKLGVVAHAGESLLGRLRDGEIALDPKITSVLLAMVDAVRQMLGSIEATGLEGERDDCVLMSDLARLQGTPEAGMSAVMESSGGNGADGSAVSASIGDTSTADMSIGDILMQRAGVTSAEILLATEKQRDGDPRRIGEILVEQGAARASDVVDALRVQQATRGQSAVDSTIRLEVSLLDRLMNLVGELVLARNQILQCAGTLEDGTLAATSQKLNLITSELQAAVMKTRMQPIGSVWNKLPRTVRDLALGCGKQVRVEMEGKETELDKTLIEAIKDPLTHLVRNAVDHGIEVPEVRRSAGKDPEGRLSLRAWHEGGQVNVEISDDGAGLDAKRIRAKAIQKGMISPEQAARMNDREIVNLVFLPGFSTVEKVTSVSGRGVGMDVVKTHIEKIGGTVELESRLGQGVTVRMKIPLTLAIIPALMVTSAGERYAVPQVNLRELVGLEGELVRTGIDFIHCAPVYRLRDRLLPLVHLTRALGIQDKAKPKIADALPSNMEQAAEATARERLNILVLEANGRRFGLVVDEVNDTEEIVVKPLGKHLKNIGIFAGATIMGDGKVALILDVAGLATSSNILAEIGSSDRSIEFETQVAADGAAGKQKVVVFTDDKGAQMAVPLNNLSRLENISGSKVERLGTQWVTQYRGQILPLIGIRRALGERSALADDGECAGFHETSTLQVLVLESAEDRFGLVVAQILDIVESSLQPRSASTRDGVLESEVIADRVTELLDVSALWRAAQPYPAAQRVEH